MTRRLISLLRVLWYDEDINTTNVEIIVAFVIIVVSFVVLGILTSQMRPNALIHVDDVVSGCGGRICCFVIVVFQIWNRCCICCSQNINTTNTTRIFLISDLIEFPSLQNNNNTTSMKQFFLNLKFRIMKLLVSLLYCVDLNNVILISVLISSSIFYWQWWKYNNSEWDCFHCEDTLLRLNLNDRLFFSLQFFIWVVFYFEDIIYTEELICHVVFQPIVCLIECGLSIATRKKNMNNNTDAKDEAQQQWRFYCYFNS